MIVITSVTRQSFHVCSGDTFALIVTNGLGYKELITEHITVARTIDYAASFRFARADGTVLGFHLSGIFANSAELPDEIKNAVMVEDLTPEQKINFLNSVGVSLAS